MEDCTAEQNTANSTPSQEKRRLFRQGAVASIPLSIAVIPWGILAGSYAMNIGLSQWEGQAMSLIMFAGAVQLVAIDLFKENATLITLLVTTFFLTARHFLYSMSMRSRISPLPFRWRLGLGFLLTDELFAICNTKSDTKFEPWFALGGGLNFYLVWNMATYAGIVAGSFIPNLETFGLDFAVAATFIAIVMPNIKNKAILASVIVALALSVALKALNVGGSLIISSIVAMLVGYFTEILTAKPYHSNDSDDKETQEKSA